MQGMVYHSFLSFQNFFGTELKPPVGIGERGEHHKKFSTQTALFPISSCLPRPWAAPVAPGAPSAWAPGFALSSGSSHCLCLQRVYILVGSGLSCSLHSCIPSTYYSSALCEEKQHVFNHTLKDVLSLKPEALEQEFWASS